VLDGDAPEALGEVGISEARPEPFINAVARQNCLESIINLAARKDRRRTLARAVELYGREKAMRLPLRDLVLAEDEPAALRLAAAAAFRYKEIPSACWRRAPAPTSVSPAAPTPLSSYLTSNSELESGLLDFLLGAGADPNLPGSELCLTGEQRPLQAPLALLARRIGMVGVSNAEDIIASLVAAGARYDEGLIALFPEERRAFLRQGAERERDAP